jgi:hypothetical protein
MTALFTAVLVPALFVGDYWCRCGIIGAVILLKMVVEADLHGGQLILLGHSPYISVQETYVHR